LCRDQVKGCVSAVVILKQTQTDTKGEFNLLREHFKLTGKVEVELESPFDWELRTRLIGGSNPWELSRWGAGAGGVLLILHEVFKTFFITNFNYAF